MRLVQWCLLLTFTRHTGEWWRVIPAWTLLALGGIVALTLLPGTERLMAALVFLGLACEASPHLSA